VSRGAALHEADGDLIRVQVLRVKGMLLGQGGLQMNEMTAADGSPRWVKHHHNGVNIRIALDGDRGSVPAGATIIAEGTDERIIWRSLESTCLTEAVAEVKNYADQWVDQGMPSSSYQQHLNPEK
jgi:hypothetical protein